MKSKLKKKLTACGLCMFGLTSLVATNAFAANYDNYDFSFRIQGSVDNAQDPTDHYRNTTDNSNAWKIILDSSGEGNGTVTDFQIELEDSTNASSQHHVKQGNGAYFFPANDYGDNNWVYLTGENNNFSSTKQYDVSGTWNPASGVHVES